MAFYVGCYLISEDSLSPKHDRENWAFPADDAQHIGDTSNVEELLVLPTAMDVLPTQIQFGSIQYTDDEGFVPDHEAFDQFYVASELFYIRSFTKGSNLYTEFYPKTQEMFYIRSFTKGSNLYTEFYPGVSNFYTRSFTGVDFFYSIPEDIC